MLFYHGEVIFIYMYLSDYFVLMTSEISMYLLVIWILLLAVQVFCSLSLLGLYKQ